MSGAVGPRQPTSGAVGPKQPTSGAAAGSSSTSGAPAGPRPPASGATSAPPAPSYAPLTHPLFDEPAAPGGHPIDQSRRFVGGPVAQVSTPPAQYPASSDPSAPAPQQRGRGTIYGGPVAHSPIDMTMPVSMSAMENSGSLTGHILAQGWDQGADTARRSNVKVAIAMLVVLLFLVGISLLFLATAGTAFSDWIHGVFKG
jgi:hypothetical protein